MTIPTKQEAIEDAESAIRRLVRLYPDAAAELGLDEVAQDLADAVAAFTPDEGVRLGLVNQQG